MKRIIPSVLSADFGHLADDIDADRSEAAWVHIDVMTAYSCRTFRSISADAADPQRNEKVLDTHLMIVNPENTSNASPRPARTSSRSTSKRPTTCTARSRRSKGGRQSRLFDQAENAGVGNRTYLNELGPGADHERRTGLRRTVVHRGSTEKVAELRREIDRCWSQAMIEIDGGITLNNAAEVYAAGCEVLVAGSGIRQPGSGRDNPQTVERTDKR